MVPFSVGHVPVQPIAARFHCGPKAPAVMTRTRYLNNPDSTRKKGYKAISQNKNIFFKGTDFRKKNRNFVFGVTSETVRVVHFRTIGRGDSMILTFHMPPLTSGQGLCDIDKV